MKCFRRVLLSLLAMMLLSGAAEALEADGYIIRLREDVAFLSSDSELPAGVEEVRASENLYKTSDETLLRELEEAGMLVYAEPDYVVTLEDVPDDPYWTNGTQWSLSMLGMEEVWAQELTGSGVRVGVIDSGIYAHHEEFAGTAIVPGTNYCEAADSEGRTDTSDTVGHGTFVSGIIAAGTNNGTGVAGMAPGVELVPLKCFTENTGSMSAIVAAIYGGVNDYGCQILNMSWGLETESETLKEAIAYAAQAGVLMVAAAGNVTGGGTSTGSDPLNYPAAYDTVISVGAVDREKEIASFSYQNESVFVTAPGKNLIGLNKSGASAYKTGSGTSFAAPAVTAAAALALTVRPELTQAELAEALRDTAEDLGDPGYDTVYGWGLLHVGRLLSRLSFALAWEEGGAVLATEQAGFQAGTTVTVTAAAYDARGVLFSAACGEAVVGEDGVLRVSELRLPLDRQNGKVKLFFLEKDTLSPLRGTLEREAAPAS